jgi:hypothetical protein
MSADRETFYIPYRDYCAYPDSDKRNEQLEALFSERGIDIKRPHDIVYNQTLRRYEIYGYRLKSA